MGGRGYLDGQESSALGAGRPPPHETSRHPRRCPILWGAERDTTASEWFSPNVAAHAHADPQRVGNIHTHAARQCVAQS
eukprot:884628-Pyramimonas_sp.AAC.1